MPGARSMPEGWTGSIADIMGVVGDIFDTAITMVGSVANEIASEPILLLFCVLPICGIAVGFFKRLMSTH